MNVEYINAQYASISYSVDPNAGESIRGWMERKNISFAELSFTEVELEEKMHRVMVQYINRLYDRLDQGENLNPNGDESIRFWMNRRNISFAELNFTEAELEEKMHRVMVQYINRLYAQLDPNNDRGIGESIRFWMNRRNISFAELNFTEAELEEKAPTSQQA